MPLVGSGAGVSKRVMDASSRVLGVSTRVLGVFRVVTHGSSRVLDRCLYDGRWSSVSLVS